MKIRRQRERMAETKAQLDQLLNAVSERDGKFSAEEHEKADKITEDLRSQGEVLNQLVEQEKRDLEFAKSTGGPPPDPINPEPRQAPASGIAARGYQMDQRAISDFGRFMRALAENRNQDAMKIAVAHASSEEEKRALSMGIGEEGGLLTPDKWRQDILMIQPEMEIVMPLATVIPGGGDAPDASEHFPALRQGASGALGGLTFSWIAEAGAKPETDYNLDDVELEPKEYAAHVVVTDKLLRNSAVAGAFLRQMLNMGIVQFRDLAFLTGNGVGQPLGVFNVANPAAVNVARTGAGLIDFTDVANMLARFPADSWGNGVWVANQSALPQIVTIDDANGNSIYIAGDASRAIPPTLFGMRIKWTGRTAVLGSRGDLGLIDFRYYLVKEGSGPQIAASEHVYFLTNRTVVKAFGNYDGSPWVLAPLTLDDGVTTVSPFVILQ
jgi:HK97 family phage major capsid protein